MLQDPLNGNFPGQLLEFRIVRHHNHIPLKSKDRMIYMGVTGARWSLNGAEAVLRHCASPPHVCILSCDLVRLRASEVHSRGKMKLENEINILQFFSILISKF